VSPEQPVKQIQIDANGHVIRQVGVREPAQPGKNLALSIDLRLQYLAYRYLKQAVAENYAESGSAVVLDVETGEVLALVNQPSFNPNNRSRVNPDAVRNRAVVDQMEPGSTVKPFSIMAAIDAGVARPSDVINTSPGYLHVGSKTFVDPVNYGPLDVNGIIKKSSQVGTIKLALAAGPEPIRNMYANVGFGEALGTGFPGESAGVLPNHRRWPEVTKANYAFGYGFTTSVLQLAQAYSVIANGGIKKPVSLLRIDQEPLGIRVVDQELAEEMQQMLASVLEKDGTGKRAKLAHYSAAGKSGTAHLIGDAGYADNRYRSLFAGFAPLEDPKVVVVAVISEPKSGKYYGGEVAAPVFSDIAQAALRLLEVPPNIAQPQLAGGGQ
jgi:cell division protein FtsI (penicillin-binding protein 3)